MKYIIGLLFFFFGFFAMNRPAQAQNKWDTMRNSNGTIDVKKHNSPNASTAPKKKQNIVRPLTAKSKPAAKRKYVNKKRTRKH